MYVLPPTGGAAVGMGLIATGGGLVTTVFGVTIALLAVLFGILLEIRRRRLKEHERRSGSPLDTRSEHPAYRRRDVHS